ncbi:MAG: hypothetical protein WC047_03650, partial [Kiritimatiellales bacterium]
VRTAANGTAICISNFSNVRKELRLDERVPEFNSASPCTDLLSGMRYNGANKKISLDPYQTVWLTT